MAKKIIKLTESDLNRIVGKVIKEQSEERKHTIAVQEYIQQMVYGVLILKML